MKKTIIAAITLLATTTALAHDDWQVVDNFKGSAIMIAVAPGYAEEADIGTCYLMEHERGVSRLFVINYNEEPEKIVPSDNFRELTTKHYEETLEYKKCDSM